LTKIPYSGATLRFASLAFNRFEKKQQGVCVMEKKVLVIGAGVSGLACARSLRESGRNVLVLEGRDRVGGRINTVDGCDLGASWIHGATNNPISDFLSCSGVETMASPSNGNTVVCFDKDGVRLSAQAYDESEQEFDRLLNVVLDKKREELESDKDLKSSLLEEVSLTPVLWGQMLGMHSLMGADLDVLSTWVKKQNKRKAERLKLTHKYWDDDAGNEGEDRYFPKGYIELVNLIAADTKIVFNCVVSKVQEKQDCVEVITNNKKKPNFFFF
jgi:monoamine oxidase